ncbi:tripartite tricarboxylate transporter substrate binding protein [Microbacterium resistens]|uniref:tripartite tricarboxylate transporter substrate binding protein n=1 Tax=Microbacterium resistens TaxID=156977 RepID=UPI001C5A30F7|nr:tripartite tricarboxylate transporter substrate-binding protein [Microbacterium resistens]MBW1639450.1 tripartite tricarboxylate transporter substrate binding protein [Microbacterium resistens]
MRRPASSALPAASFSRRTLLRGAVAGATAAALAGCAPLGPQEIDSPARRILVPAAVGGGYDLTARTAAKILLTEGIVAPLPDVFNVPGGGGVPGLVRTIAAAGEEHLALAMGLGIVGAAWASGLTDELAALTPLAQVATEPGVVLVPPDSPFRTLDAALAAWRADPAGLRVSTGSSPGGPDHLLVVQVARAAGVDPSAIRLSAASGGGELLSRLLTGEADLAFGGAGELRRQLSAGVVRAVAVSSAERVAGLDVPTLTESGIDVVFRNWRGFVAPPGIGAAARERWIDDLSRMRRARAWRDALVENGWDDAFVTGAAFGERIRQQLGVVAATLS